MNFKKYALLIFGAVVLLFTVPLAVAEAGDWHMGESLLLLTKLELNAQNIISSCAQAGAIFEVKSLSSGIFPMVGDLSLFLYAKLLVIIGVFVAVIGKITLFSPS